MTRLLSRLLSRRVVRGAVLGAGIAAAVFLFSTGRSFSGMENRAVDFWFRLRGPLRPAPEVVIVAMDDASVSHYGDLPWPRRRHAAMVQLLHRAGARCVLFDLLLVRPDRVDAVGDRLLAAAMTDAGNVLLPLYFPQPDANEGGLATAPGFLDHSVSSYTRQPRYIVNHVKRVVPPTPELAEAAKALGHINVYPELDGVVRRACLMIDFNGRPYPSLSLVAAAAALGIPPRHIQLDPEHRRVIFGNTSVPVDDGWEMPLNFVGPYEQFRYYSFRDVLERHVPLTEFRNKVVIIGATSTQRAAMYPTPYSPVFPGAEINATVIDNLLHHRWLRRASPVVNLLVILAAGTLVGACTLLASLYLGFLGIVITAAAVAGCCYASFVHANLCVDIVRPLIAMTAALGSGLIYRLRLQERASARVQSTVETLVRMAKILGSPMDQPLLLDLMLNWVTEVLNAEAASVLLLDEPRQNLMFAVATGIKAENVKQFTLKIGEGIAGWVAQHGEMLNVPDVSRDPRFNRNIDKAVRFSTRSILCVPLRTGDEIIGVVEAVNKVDSPRFTAADEELLTAMAAQIFAVLEKAQLYELLEQRIELANDELKQINFRLHTEMSKLESVLSSMSDGVIVIGPDLDIVMVNRAAHRLLSLGDDPVTGRKLCDLPIGSELQHLLNEAETQGAAAVAREIELPAEDEEQRTLHAQVAPLTDRDGKTVGAVTVLADISQLKELDRMKSQFVSFVSHELRAPITSIKGFATTLLRGKPFSEEQQRNFLGIINNECDRMHRLITNLLDLARIEAGRGLDMHLETVDLRAVVERVLVAQSMYAENHKFVTHFPDELPDVEIDTDKIEQVLINLVTNAAKYSPGGGEVEITVAAEDECIAVHVKDHGVGMDKEQIARLFERFQRARTGAAAAVRGTGLGLFLTKHLVDAHHGEIEVVSAPGEGSVFSVRLPLKQP